MFGGAPLGGVRCFYFDSIGVPPIEAMRRDFGSPEAWQADATQRWVARLAEETADGAIAVLDAQLRPSVLQAVFAQVKGLAVRIVLLECDIPVRNSRLVSRGNPELATPRLDSWASYLRGQADALNLSIVDTTNVTAEAVADALESEIEAFSVQVRAD